MSPPSLPGRSRRTSAALVPTPERRTPVLAQLAHDASLAALLGGNLFGRVAMHPALRDVSVERERGQVLNHAWRRYGTVNSLSLVGLVGGWRVVRREESGRRWMTPRRRTLILAKDVAVGAVVVTGLASAAGGIGFAQQASEGAVPLADGSQPAPATPQRARSIKRLENILGRLNLAAEVGLLVADALLERSVP